jgi:hypothetical protein
MDGSGRGTVLTRLAHLVSIVAVHFPAQKVTVIMILELKRISSTDAEACH